MKRFPRAILPLYLLACLAVDLLPRQRPPHFRYTGSDPSFVVWNFGYPLAQFIYDPRNGLHAGPLAWHLLFAEALVFAGLITLAIRHRPPPKLPSTSRRATSSAPGPSSPPAT